MTSQRSRESYLLSISNAKPLGGSEYPVGHSFLSMNCLFLFLSNLGQEKLAGELYSHSENCAEMFHC